MNELPPGDPSEQPTQEYDLSEERTLVLSRQPVLDPARRGEDRIAYALLKFGLVAGFLALEAILLLAVADIMGVR